MVFTPLRDKRANKGIYDAYRGILKIDHFKGCYTCCLAYERI
jgi:hypothetical protein